MRLLLFAAILSLAGLSGYLVLNGASLLPALGVDAVREFEWTPTDSVETAVRDVRPLAVPHPVRTSIRTERYRVGGGTAGRLLGSLQDAGPRVGSEVYFGLTVSEMNLGYSKVEMGGECELRKVRVDLDLTVTLPEWDAPPDADPGLVHEWRQFQQALADHEDEHRRIAEEGAASLYWAVQGLRRASCDEADADGRRRVKQVEIEVQAAHRRFDDLTGHGRTQGAVWPLPKG